MQPKDEIDLSGVTPFYAIEEGDVVSPIQVYKKNNVVAFLASFPLDFGR